MDFFQAIHQLESQGLTEKLFFRATPSLSFPVHDINKIIDNNSSIELQVNIFGLFGHAGVLPDHYTELLLERLQAKDTTLRDFFDIFNHRLIYLYYRAWVKYRYYIEPAPFKQLLLSLVGNGAENILYYTGLFAQQTRSAANLAAILTDYFATPIVIKQFQGKWLAIARQACSQLGKNYYQLGQSALLGQRSWDVQNNFRVQVGPLSYQSFREYLPDKPRLHALREIVRHYIGVALSFDVQLVLQADEVPSCRLQRKNSFNLGWNTWLKIKAFEKDADDAVF